MRTLSPKELEIGMIVAEPIVTPIGQILAPAGTEITRQLINRMKLYKVEEAVVYGDSPQTENVEEDSEAAKPATEKQAPARHVKTHAEESKTHSQKVAASDEFRDFQMKYFLAIDNLKSVFASADKTHETIDTTALMESVSDLFRARNTIVEMFDMLFNMRIISDSVYSHCLNVGLISRMIGRWLKLEKHDLNILTLAGLLHDIGKIRIPEDILNKPGKLTDEEYAMIKQHPKFGYDILKNQPIDSRIKKAALMHHERCDGSGYPSNLTDDLIDEFAMIIAIADVYDAMTATRSYRAPLCPFQVIANFEEEGYQKYHTKYILTFLKQIAAAYQNNRVILNDGRGCNIVLLNQTAYSRPMVQLDDGSIIDLNTHRDLYIKSVI